MYVEEFHQPVGVRVPVPDTVRGVFELIFDQPLVEHIVQETNRYAKTVMGESKYEKWETIEVRDFYAYFGVMIMMGLVEFPSLHDYWKRDSLFNCPAIAERMTRDRFLEIHRYLHFVNNDTLSQQATPGYNRIGKMRGVLSMIEQRFVALYHPSRECAIDEAMVPYKGRSTLKQYIPKKPKRKGLKVWMRADSNNGYVSQYQVYVGRETSAERWLGARVIKDLSRSLVHKHYHLFCDNFFYQCWTFL